MMLIPLIALAAWFWMSREEKELDKAERDAQKAMDQLQRSQQTALGENKGMQDKK